MAITYTWKNVKCTAYPSKDDLTNVIYSVEGTCVVTDDNGGSAEKRISVGIGQPNSETFISLNDVTKDQATQWLESALSTENLNAFKNELAESIQIIKTFED